MAHEERTDEVRVDDAPPFAGREICDGFPYVDPGVVYEDVHLTEALDYGLSEALNVLLP